MDPIRNPYAPGAGQRPPELAGRDEQLERFRVVLERIARGRPERSMVLTGLRGVGKTVLLNALRGTAVRSRWGTGKYEARPEQGMRRPMAAALHVAVRELGHPQGDEVDHVLGVIKAFAQKDQPGAKLRDRWNPGIEVAAVTGRADSGDIEIDLVELLSDVGGLAADVGKGVAVFIDEMQDLQPDDVSAICAACHELSQSALPVIVVGAGLPHLPAVLSASKSYSERLFRYTRIDRLSREQAERALQLPAEDEDAAWSPDALEAMYAATGGYPYFLQAYGKEVWDLAPESPISPEDVRVAGPEAEAELAVGFFGSRYERATPGEREYLRAMADLAAERAETGEEVDEIESVATSDIATHLGRKPQSLSPARDALLKKGLIYSGERGRIAFTVPHFGRYLREHT
ncbi:RecA-superfamily ATPases implicated in signal transduction [Serinicoccus hydrothermalis]|uniref:RecA-superfamily ATPases implicated in signal transduction n=1 Tax=Serinicoccus hydrothermalis TaxID=1758689 RepID=A0A1B1NCD6_9MICO|nr:ATP-binding protein [Serinicoccus hydrothermalis]ANS79092.1 RecA-superfamily ATPases implicated in signal transduction [Serinicoccus hydrothermalis]